MRPNPSGELKSPYRNLVLDDLTNSYRVHCSTTMLDEMGYGGTSEAMTAGFVVAESATIVWDSIPATEQVVHILLRGYLVDRQ